MAISRITATINGVGVIWTTREVKNTPARYRILRARALIVDGPATKVALRVRESSEDLASNIPLEYTLTDTYIDSAESVYFQGEQLGNSSKSTVSTYLEVKTNELARSTIVVILDIEA